MKASVLPPENSGFRKHRIPYIFTSVYFLCSRELPNIMRNYLVNSTGIIITGTIQNSVEFHKISELNNKEFIKTNIPLIDLKSGRTYKTSPRQNVSSTKRLHTKRLQTKRLYRYTQRRLLNKTSP
jgi:hypothetical protein